MLGMRMLSHHLGTSFISHSSLKDGKLSTGQGNKSGDTIPVYVTVFGKYICHGYWSGMILSFYKLPSTSLNLVDMKSGLLCHIKIFHSVMIPVYFEMREFKVMWMYIKTCCLVL